MTNGGVSGSHISGFCYGSPYSLHKEQFYFGTQREWGRPYPGVRVSGEARPSAGSGPHSWLCSPLASNRSLWGFSFNLSPPSTADSILLVPGAVPAERLPEAPLGPDPSPLGQWGRARPLGTGGLRGSLEDSAASSSRAPLLSGPLPSLFLPASAPVCPLAALFSCLI